MNTHTAAIPVQSVWQLPASRTDEYYVPADPMDLLQCDSCQ